MFVENLENCRKFPNMIFEISEILKFSKIFKIFKISKFSEIFLHDEKMFFIQIFSTIWIMSLQSQKVIQNTLE